MPFRFKQGQKVMVGSKREPGIFQANKGHGMCRVLFGDDQRMVKRRTIREYAVNLDAVKDETAALRKRLKDLGFKAVSKSHWRIGNSVRWVDVELSYDGRHMAHGFTVKNVAPVDWEEALREFDWIPFDPPESKHTFVAMTSSVFGDEEGMLKAITFETTRQQDGVDPKVQRHF